MQHGRLVFRLKANFLVLHEQICFDAHRLPLRCTVCGFEDRVGELTVIDNPPLFYCESCLFANKNFAPIVHVRSVVNSHYVEASRLFMHAFDKQKEISDEFLFWFGQKWSRIKSPLANLHVFHSRQVAIEFYNSVAERAKQSMDMLSLCLMRLGIYKDLRQFIVKIIWPNEIICWLEE